MSILKRRSINSSLRHRQRKRSTRRCLCEVLEQRHLLAASVAVTSGWHRAAVLAASDTGDWMQLLNVATYSNRDSFGRSATVLGDLDKDGVTDVAVGAGASVFILFMNSNGTVKGHHRLDGGFSFGPAVAPLGDLDGDGSPDLAVSESSASTYGRGRGVVHMFFLNPMERQKE